MKKNCPPPRKIIITAGNLNGVRLKCTLKIIFIHYPSTKYRVAIKHELLQIIYIFLKYRVAIKHELLSIIHPRNAGLPLNMNFYKSSIHEIQGYHYTLTFIYYTSTKYRVTIKRELLSIIHPLNMNVYLLTIHEIQGYRGHMNFYIYLQLDDN